jgi:hypothetical protein
MPIATVESLQQRAARLKKKLAEAGESLAGPAARALKKRIRRAQRFRRRLEARKARLAGKTDEKKG